MHSSRFSHPAHWAGYVAAGDVDQLGLVAPRTSNPWYAAGAAVALAVVSLLPYVTRRARARSA